ncbi:hypothetical protein KEM52_005603 [Ascosphaera acerosa]|nr:hypothetical protein KEM52_005603 [Ascosphaera acerosa]
MPPGISATPRPSDKSTSRGPPDLAPGVSDRILGQNVSITPSRFASRGAAASIRRSQSIRSLASTPDTADNPGKKTERTSLGPSGYKGARSAAGNYSQLVTNAKQDLAGFQDSQRVIKGRRSGAMGGASRAYRNDHAAETTPLPGIVEAEGLPAARLTRIAELNAKRAVGSVDDIQYVGATFNSRAKQEQLHAAALSMAKAHVAAGMPTGTPQIPLDQMPPALYKAAYEAAQRHIRHAEAAGRASRGWVDIPEDLLSMLNTPIPKRTFGMGAMGAILHPFSGRHRAQPESDLDETESEVTGSQAELSSISDDGANETETEDEDTGPFSGVRRFFSRRMRQDDTEGETDDEEEQQGGEETGTEEDEEGSVRESEAEEQPAGPFGGIRRFLSRRRRQSLDEGEETEPEDAEPRNSTSAVGPSENAAGDEEVDNRGPLSGVKRFLSRRKQQSMDQGPDTTADEPEATTGGQRETEPPTQKLRKLFSRRQSAGDKSALPTESGPQQETQEMGKATSAARGQDVIGPKASTETDPDAIHEVPSALGSRFQEHV